MEMGIFLGTFLPPLVHMRGSLKCHFIVILDKTNWPGCLLWHGWLPALSGRALGNPWAGDAHAVAKNRLEIALGSYVGVHQDAFGEEGLEEAGRDLAAGPLVWTDGSLVLDKVYGVGVGGVCTCVWCTLVQESVGSSSLTSPLA